MRGNPFTYRPNFKLTIIGNHAPMLSSVDGALRRRFNIVPFLHKPEKPDHALERKLRAEWPGILRWMIDGCIDWRQNGLIRPPGVLNATENYFAEQDVLSQWLESECSVEI